MLHEGVKIGRPTRTIAIHARTVDHISTCRKRDPALPDVPSCTSDYASNDNAMPSVSIFMDL